MPCAVGLGLGDGEHVFEGDGLGDGELADGDGLGDGEVLADCDGLEDGVPLPDGAVLADRGPVLRAEPCLCGLADGLV